MIRGSNKPFESRERVIYNEGLIFVRRSVTIRLPRCLMERKIDIHPFGEVTLQDVEAMEDPDLHGKFISENWVSLAGFAYLMYREKGGGAVVLLSDEREMIYVTRGMESSYEKYIDEESESFIRQYDPEEQVVIVFRFSPGSETAAYLYKAKNVTPSRAGELLLSSVIKGL